jgi:hypothetical protein
VLGVCSYTAVRRQGVFSKTAHHHISEVNEKSAGCWKRPNIWIWVPKLFVQLLDKVLCVYRLKRLCGHTKTMEHCSFWNYCVSRLRLNTGRASVMSQDSHVKNYQYDLKTACLRVISDIYQGLKIQMLKTLNVSCQHNESKKWTFISLSWMFRLDDWYLGRFLGWNLSLETSYFAHDHFLPHYYEFTIQ